MTAATRGQRQAQPQLLQAALNALLQPDLRQRLLFVFAMLVVFRFISNLPVPGVDPRVLQDLFRQNTILGFLNFFSGGALKNMSVAAMGVYPYVTAAIVMQLLVPLVPTLRALSQEGEYGRRQIEIYTHWLTVPMALLQGYGQLILIQSLLPGSIQVGFTGETGLRTITILITMAAGTMFLVWLGELITEKGIGNGISILIFAGIVSGLPEYVGARLFTGVGGTVTSTLMLGLFTLGLVYLIVFFQEAQRRIPVQYSRSVFRGGRMYRQSGQTHIPLRVNSVGMVPLIFAYSIILLPAYVGQVLAQNSNEFISNLGEWAQRAFTPGNPFYWLLLFLSVVIFTFFYTLVIFQQQNLAENLQRQGGFIPGIRPGKPTEEYINRVLMRITWAGALFLGFVAVSPFLIGALMEQDVSLRGRSAALGISASGLIIVVGVVLDTMRQIEAQLLMRQYEGFIR
ncbi:MAG: preprotein translocase subunit SecY [Dehalococcoidia bacterium]|nr:preprotein translocase subunit SecY [Dehalococcoidia bacterium]MDW8008250.1 preprotein translocase subunit SecY [Chloroflexota bacterium]